MKRLAISPLHTAVSSSITRSSINCDLEKHLWWILAWSSMISMLSNSIMVHKIYAQCLNHFRYVTLRSSWLPQSIDQNKQKITGTSHLTLEFIRQARRFEKTHKKKKTHVLRNSSNKARRRRSLGRSDSLFARLYLFLSTCFDLLSYMLHFHCIR